MVDTPYYRDAVYERFSEAEYERRYEALRQKMVERIKELGLERGRIGLLEVDPRFHDYLPVNQYNALKEGLPEATFSFEAGWMHELVYRKSPEELDCIRKAGRLCRRRWFRPRAARILVAFRRGLTP